MSLLKKPEMKTRWKKSLLVAVSLLLLVPCAAAAAFAMRFDVETSAQEPALTAKDKEKQKEKEKLEVLERKAQTTEELRLRDPALAQEMQRKRELEVEAREVTQAAMVKLAKISMEQAIQIATSQQPGKVLISSLGAKGWEEPGKLGKEGVVFYHVIIADEANPGSTHVWVNAIDGTIIKTEKELPRKKVEP